MIDYSHLQQSLKKLEEFLATYRQLEESKDEDFLRMAQMGIVRAYEICYAATFKTLERYLHEEGVQASPSPKGLVRAANENELLPSPPEQWFKYIDARGRISSEHLDEMGEEILAVAPEFVDDAIGLYQTMSGETWE